MALTLEASGTQTATVGTEHTLASITTPRTLAAYVDLSNMASGDVVEIRVKIKIKSTGALVVFSLDIFQGAQNEPKLFYAPFMPSDLQWDLTLKQTAGTGRAFDWRVLSYI